MRTCGGSRDRYATEKLWNAYRAGAVPVYVGPAADLLREQWLPTHSWIDGSSFASHEALANYLRHLAANPEEYVTCAPRDCAVRSLFNNAFLLLFVCRYDAYFAWKALPLPPMLARVKANDFNHLACNTCAAVRRAKRGEARRPFLSNACEGQRCFADHRESL
jgi:hypothetical protein